MGSAEREKAAAKLDAQLRELVSRFDAKVISCFLSTPTEPDVRPFLEWAASQEIRVLFPVTRDDGLLDWTVGEELTESAGLYGMPEPAGELLGPIAINDVDLIIVPAAAVDGHTGMRLGWGRGYYDRSLGSMEGRPPVYAVVFEHEILDDVPCELHDEPVDGVVTPDRIIDFHPAARGR